MLSKNIQREQKGQRRKYKLCGIALAVAELSWQVFSKLHCWGKEGVWNVMKCKFLQIMAWSCLVAWSCSWGAKNTVNTPFSLCAWSLLLFLFIRVGSGLRLCLLKEFLTIPKLFTAETAKQTSTIKWLNVEIKGSGVPALLALVAPCVQECIHSNATALQWEKHQETQMCFIIIL